jgi:DNA-binding MarR family transcriptional regulator
MLRSVVRQLDAATEGVVGEAGLTRAQLAVLQALSDSPGATAATLARRLGITPQSMMELVHRLERAELIVRGPATGRSVELILTEDGLRAVMAGRESAATVEESLAAGMPPSEVADLRFLLEAVSRNLSRVTGATRQARPDE